MRVRFSSGWLKLVVGAGIILSVVRIHALSQHARWERDYRIFRRVGMDVLAGLDPYDRSRFWHHIFLNPPSTFPLFAALALLPEQLGPMIWTVFNSILALLIVPLALPVLRQEFGGVEWANRSVLEVGPLAVVFALSAACTRAIDTGQVALLAAFLILLALCYRGRRPFLAGVLLALSSIKVNTMAPFLLLFLRRRDRATWVSCAVTTVLLLLVAGHPERLIDQAQTMLRYVGMASQPGWVNDLTLTGSLHETIIGLDGVVKLQGHEVVGVGQGSHNQRQYFGTECDQGVELLADGPRVGIRAHCQTAPEPRLLPCAEGGVECRL